MTITFDCPECGRPIRTKDAAAGKSGRCNDCGSALTVPARAQQLEPISRAAVIRRWLAKLAPGART